MVLARQFDVDVARATDVARAPTPLQGVEVQGRGGLATSGGNVQGRGGLATPNGLATPDVARAPSPLRDHFIFDTIYTP